jgi:excisionase family DNA binding protein
MESQLRPRLVSTRDAANYLAISAWQLRQLVHSGKLPYIEDGARSWRFDVHDLDCFIEGQKTRVVL